MLNVVFSFFFFIISYPYPANKISIIYTNFQEKEGESQRIIFFNKHDIMLWFLTSAHLSHFLKDRLGEERREERNQARKEFHATPIVLYVAATTAAITIIKKIEGKIRIINGYLEI